jgi:hypothetical protein
MHHLLNPRFQRIFLQPPASVNANVWWLAAPKLAPQCKPDKPETALIAPSQNPTTHSRRLVQTDPWLVLLRLVRSSEWPFEFLLGQRRCGTESSWCAFFLTHCMRLAGLIPHRWSQVASEKAEVAAALVEYERDISLLESIYNEHKALLDHRRLDTDLKELEQCV